MQNYTNYLYHNYNNNIDHFAEIIDNLIQGNLLPKNMNEQIQNKIKEWFGPDWSYIFGYDTCDKNYSKPKLNPSDPIYKFIISFPVDENAYDSFVEDARAFLLDIIVKLFSHDKMRLRVCGDITQYKFNISDYFEVFQNRLNEIVINVGEGCYTLFNGTSSYNTSGDYLTLELKRCITDNCDSQFICNYYVKIKRFGIEGDIDECGYFENWHNKTIDTIIKEIQYELDTFFDYTSTKEELIIKKYITIYKVDKEGTVLMDTPLIEKEIIRSNYE